MAVFTEVGREELNRLLNQYDIGKAQRFEGISSGIENSNFYLDTDKGKYVLTVFERLNKEQVPYYLELTHHLGKKGLNVSAPIPAKDGSLSSEVCGKPCCIAACIPGQYVELPSAKVCGELGAVLAQMHSAVEDFPLVQENTKGSKFWLSVMPGLKPYLPERLYELLEEEVSYQVDLENSPAYKALPNGAVHADLFRNNSLIEVNGKEEKLGGIIDFYFACNAPFLYDLAVVLNDWCINLETGEIDMPKAQALIDGYNSVRALTEADRELWQDMLRRAALRFWVSRLYDYYMPRPASLLKPHDPSHFEKILLLRRKAKTSDLPWI